MNGTFRYCKLWNQNKNKTKLAIDETKKLFLLTHSKTQQKNDASYAEQSVVRARATKILEKFDYVV